MAESENLFISGEEVRGSMAAETPAASQPLPPVKPQPVGDARLAAILQKQASGQPLTPSEAGYLGSVKRRGKAKAVAAAPSHNPLPRPAPASPSVADNLLFEEESQPDAVAQAPVAPSYNPASLRAACDKIISSTEFLLKLWIGHEANQAHADKQSTDEYKSAVAWQPDNRQQVVENSDPYILWLCEKFKCTPEKLEGILNPSSIVGRWSARQGRQSLDRTAPPLTRRPARGVFRLGFACGRSVRNKNPLGTD